jgi:hypothetical protein
VGDVIEVVAVFQECCKRAIRGLKECCKKVDCFRLCPVCTVAWDCYRFGVNYDLT